jgi:hypothetical protein
MGSQRVLVLKLPCTSTNSISQTSTTTAKAKGLVETNNNSIIMVTTIDNNINKMGQLMAIRMEQLVELELLNLSKKTSGISRTV